MKDSHGSTSRDVVFCEACHNFSETATEGKFIKTESFQLKKIFLNFVKHEDTWYSDRQNQRIQLKPSARTGKYYQSSEQQCYQQVMCGKG